MYLTKININNYGPIKQVTLLPDFNDDGLPKPVVLIGQNGTGKTLLLF